MSNIFTWTDLYQELADKVLSFKNDRTTFVKLVEKSYKAVNLEYKLYWNGHYIDLRNKKGPLWLIGGEELQEFADSCNKYGYEFAFASNGSKGTNGRPGWWLKRGGK